MTRESLPPWLSGYAMRVREPGDTAGPFRIPGGWVLLQLVSVDRAHVPPIDTVRPRIEAAVRAEAAQRAMRTALSGPDSRD
jgi:parvulin-like peptidyl-prolyl isomerase